eukprot:jgi/Mesen1/4398/ME000223S03467
MEKPESFTKPVEGSLRFGTEDMSQSGRKGEKPAIMVRVGKAVYQLPAIQQWDLNGDGVITEEELAAAAVSHGQLQSQAVNYRRMALGLLLLLVVSVGVMIASVVIGVRLSRETKVDGSRLLTTDGDVVQVAQAYGSPTLLSLFNTTWTQLHSIRHVTLYVFEQNAVLSFKVEEVRRNATMLSLTSAAASTLYITESAATLADSQGQRFLVEGSEEPGGDARRRLLKKGKRKGHSQTLVEVVSDTSEEGLFPDSQDQQVFFMENSVKPEMSGWRRRKNAAK